MVGKFERRKDTVQELTEAGATTVGRIAAIIVGAVRDINREVGGFVSDSIEMHEASVKARQDEKRVSGPTTDIDAE